MVRLITCRSINQTQLKTSYTYEVSYKRERESYNCNNEPSTPRKLGKRDFLKISGGGALAVAMALTPKTAKATETSSGFEYCFWVKYDPRDMAKADPTDSAASTPEYITHQEHYRTDFMNPLTDVGSAFLAIHEFPVNPAGFGDWTVRSILVVRGPAKTAKPTSEQSGLSHITWTPNYNVYAADSWTGSNFQASPIGKIVDLRLATDLSGNPTGEYAVAFNGSVYSEAAILTQLPHADSAPGDDSNGHLVGRSITNICRLGSACGGSLDGTTATLTLTIKNWGIGAGFGGAVGAVNHTWAPLEWKVVMLKRIKNSGNEWEVHKEISPPSGAGDGTLNQP